MGLRSAQMGISVQAMQSTPHSRISGLMEESGISVKALAEATSIPRVTLSRRLADPSTFTLSEVERVAEALGVSALFLLTGKDAA